MTAFARLAAIAADPEPQCQTARQIIEARLGQKLPPTKELPPDLRDALRRLGLQLVKIRRKA